MSIKYTVIEGTFPIPSPTALGSASKDTLILDKMSGLLSVISNVTLVFYTRYTEYSPGNYTIDPYGDYYRYSLTGDYFLYSELPPNALEESFLPVPSTAYGIATFTTYSPVEGVLYYAEGLTDIRPPFVKNSGVYKPSLGPSEVYTWLDRAVHYTGGELIIPDVTPEPHTIATQTGETASTIRRTLSFPVPVGQYEVRLRRVSPDTDSNRIADTLVWTALRSHQITGAITEPYMAKTALRIRATDQLNGSINTYNTIAQLICLDYDSYLDEWVERPTSNPASLYRFVLQGPANKRPLGDDQIDLDALEEWHAICEEEQFEFNHYVDYQSSVDSILGMIAAAGRAVPGYIDGKFGVVMDRVQTNIAQYFTPRNTWEYSYAKIFFDRPHAFRVKFWNRDKDWREDERIVYDDGYTEETATKFEELSLPGITSAWEAYKHARYHIATARLRPESHTFNTDFEYLTCTRGDRVKFTNDVIAVGLGYGRVKSYTDDTVNVTHITVDELLPMESGKTYQFRIRQMDGDALLINLVTAVGEWTTFEVSGVLPIASAPDIDALMMYGETDEESIDLIVKSITPTGDLTASLVCIAYAPEVHSAHTGTIPDFDSHITIPPDRASLYKPILTTVSDESVIVRIGRAVTVRLRVTALANSYPDALVETMEIRYRRAHTFNPWIKASEITNEVIVDEDIVQGRRYEIQGRYHIDGKAGLWSRTVYEIIVGTSSPPADITGFSFSQTSFNGLMLTWDPNTDLDLDYYIVKYSSLLTGGATWENSLEVGRALTTTLTLPVALDGTYFVKAVDLEGRESVTAESFITDIPSLVQFNFIEEVNDGTAWTGVKENCYSYHGQLFLDMVGLWDDITDFDAWEFIDSYGGASPEGYFYPSETVNLGSVQTARCGMAVDFEAVNAELLWDDISDFDSVDIVDGPNSGVSVEPQISYSDDGITWTGWVAFIVGDYKAKYFKFRVHLISNAFSSYPVINQFLISVDMPDRAERGQDLEVASGGTSVLFSTDYIVPPVVRVTINDASSGDTYKVSAVSATGFTIQILNSGSGVERNVDWQSVGY